MTKIDFGEPVPSGFPCYSGNKKLFYPNAKLTEMSKRLTPLQEAIHWFQTEPEAIGRWNTDDIVAFLQPFLPKEQQLLSETWDAGIESFCWDSGSEFVDTKPMNKKQFLSQFKPE